MNIKHGSIVNIRCCIITYKKHEPYARTYARNTSLFCRHSNGALRTKSSNGCAAHTGVDTAFNFTGWEAFGGLLLRFPAGHSAKIGNTASTDPVHASMPQTFRPGVVCQDDLPRLVRKSEC